MPFVHKTQRIRTTIDYGITAIGLAYHTPACPLSGEALLLYKQYDAAENAFRLAITMAPHLGQARNYLIYLYDVILKTPEKSAIHRSYFEERGLKVKSPDTEDFEDDENLRTEETVTGDFKNNPIKAESEPETEDKDETPLIVKRIKP